MQRTEVFEYAKALGNSQYTLPTFQVYKFIYAATLADLGLLQQASKYLPPNPTLLHHPFSSRHSSR